MALGLKSEVGASAVPISFARPSEYCLEYGYNSRVELRRGRFDEPSSCLRSRHCVAVLTARCHCIVCIRYGDNPGKKRDHIGTESVRVATTVHSFVMVPHDACDLRIVLHVRKDALADRRMVFHLAALFLGEWADLLEDPGGQTDFPDVVEEPAEVGELLLPLRET